MESCLFDFENRQKQGKTQEWTNDFILSVYEKSALIIKKQTIKKENEV